jgi:predicted NUDIX family NTP pyrophosphohydrolase
MYRRSGDSVEVLLVHPGGPYWAKKDLGAWSIPKGEPDDDEDPLAAARRELAEETGCTPDGEFLPLGSVTQKGGKTVFAWAVAGSCDTAALRSNRVTMEWPPRSGKRIDYPEVDRADWFSPAEAKRKLNDAQAEFVDRLCAQLGPA